MTRTKYYSQLVDDHELELRLELFRFVLHDGKLLGELVECLAQVLLDM
jgi:hypothetical protein